MIQDVDQSLWRMLAEELPKVPGCAVKDGDQITFATPAVAEATEKPKVRVNLFLHDLRENLEQRDMSYHLTRRPGEDSVGVKRAPVRLDLSYLVTCHAGDDTAQEHRLLADVLGVLLRNSAVPEKFLTGVLEGRGPNALPLSVAQPDHSAYNDPPALWQSLGGKLRPALSLLTTASFDPFETRWTRVVREAIIGLGLGTPPDGPRRPLSLSEIRVSAAGVVTDGAGEQPLPNVAVAVEGRDEKAMTDERGFFSILNLPPGPHTLKFRKRGYQSQEVQSVAPPPGQPNQLQPAVVALIALGDEERAQETAELASEAANSPALVEMGRIYRVSLSGTLRHADGRPAAFVPVRVGRQHTTTDADGVYCFFELPPGDHTVIADIPGQGETEVPANNALAPPDSAKKADGTRKSKT
ncbi:MAG: Pvc16 family protein [Armatimonadota bacterium]|nr:Pvc16 family protein [Armatimonadota bacterium]